MLPTAVRDEGWAEFLRAAAARNYGSGGAASKAPGPGAQASAPPSDRGADQRIDKIERGAGQETVKTGTCKAMAQALLLEGLKAQVLSPVIAP